MKLWLADTGNVVCERPDCAPAGLLELFGRRPNVLGQYRVGGHVWSRLSPVDLAEFSALGQTFGCDAGHTVYDALSQRLVEVVPR